MKVKAWNNGSYSPDGNGYGVKIAVHDRMEKRESTRADLDAYPS